MEKTQKPLILVSNDDGITAKGIGVLVKLMSQFAEVVVVAPSSPQSAKGHAITIYEPLKIYPSKLYGEIEAYECSGTPADCVKIAKHHIFKGRVPQLMVSGINHGSNTSVSVLYSGTMSAAIEAGLEGMPAIGFSLCDYDHDADFSHIEDLILKICKEALEKGIPSGTVLNVNFPHRQEESIKGVRICRQAKGVWQEEFDERTDPFGRKYLWLTGKFVNHDKGIDTDEWAIANNFASIVPIAYDMTAHYAVGLLNEAWELR